MTDEIHLGGVTVSASVLAKQLKQDMKDDWYPDALGYKESLNPQGLAETIAGIIDSNHGSFSPGFRTELNIPKAGFSLRYSLETSLIERAYYHAMVAQIIPYYDPLLGDAVLSHRHDGVRNEKFLFRHPIDQWKKFNNFVCQSATPGGIVLCTDVQNYFENIKITTVVDSLTNQLCNLTCSGPDKTRLRWIITTLKQCLGCWCLTSAHGLPQNRDASSFLANMVMHEVDQSMRKKGFTYFRYMDDIRIVAANKYSARSALQELIGVLRRIGLNVNGGKTKFIPAELYKESEKEEQLQNELEVLDNMFKSRSMTVIQRALNPLGKLAIKIIKANELGSRSFRFCVKRFENLALCDDLPLPATFYTEMIAASVASLDEHPHASDQLVRFLKAAPTSDNDLTPVADFLQDESKAIYDWQNYLLWQLLVSKQLKTPGLLELSRKRSADSTLQADRAGAILYLGALGDEKDRLSIAQKFRELESPLLQRNAIIAIHELDYRKVIVPHVKGHVSPFLKGSYSKLSSNYRGQYSQPLDRLRASQVYDEVTSYE